MTTQVNFTIKKDGTGDYTSIKSFVVAEGKDLVTADENHFVTIHGAGWDSTTPLSETFIDFASYTTDATRNVTFFVQTADRHNYTAGSGFVFTISTSFGLVLRSKYIILDGFEIANTINTANLFDTSTNTTLKNSLVHDVDYAQFAGDGEFNLHYNYASRGGFTNTFYNGGTLLNITCIQLGAEGGFSGDIGIANANCTNVVLYTDKVTGSFSNYYLCTGDYNAINKTGENVPGANSIENITSSDFKNFALENYISKAGGLLDGNGASGGFIGGDLETSSGATVTVTLGAINYSSQDATISLTGSVDIATTLGTISYTSQDASISITGSEDITTGLGYINYTSQAATIQLTGVIDVAPTLGSINYTSRNTTISITGSEDVSATLGAITYSSNNTTVSLTSQIDINATLGTINYTSNHVAVTLLGTVELSATLGAIVYNSYNVSVSIGEGQVIGNVTTSFANDIYSSGFKPNTITVNFK